MRFLLERTQRSAEIQIKYRKSNAKNRNRFYGAPARLIKIQSLVPVVHSHFAGHVVVRD